jgi:hypothetical protein
MYHRICELANLPYVTDFSHSRPAILMRLNHVEEHIKICDLLSIIRTCQFIISLILTICCTIF